MKKLNNEIKWTIKDWVGTSSVEAHIEGIDDKGNKYFATSYIGVEGEIVDPINIVNSNNHLIDRAGNRFVNGRCINPKVIEVIKTYKKPSFGEVFGISTNL